MLRHVWAEFCIVVSGMFTLISLDCGPATWMILESVCHVGGARFSSLGQHTKYPAENYSEPLRKVFRVDISIDRANVHPLHVLCSSCERLFFHAMQVSH